MMRMAYKRKKIGCNRWRWLHPEYKEKEGIRIMTNQEIFEILADNEEKLFYALCRDKGNETLKAAHESAKQSLESFALVTGCHN